MNKRAIQLSVNAIIILIIAIIFLSLGLAFIKGTFGKTAVKIEELILKEPEPPAADTSTPITLSRENIISKNGATELIKADIFNPTNKDWVFRDAVSNWDADLCGNDNDGVCFIRVGDPDCNSKIQDDDCLLEYDCTQNSELGAGIGCVMVISGNRTDWETQGLCIPGDSMCDCGIDITSTGNGIGKDPDCDPTEGVKLKIECSQGLNLEKLTNPKQIGAGSSTQFTYVLKIDKKTQKGTYLCKIGVEGFIEGLEKYQKDLTIKID